MASARRCHTRSSTEITFEFGRKPEKANQVRNLKRFSPVDCGVLSEA